MSALFYIRLIFRPNLFECLGSKRPFLNAGNLAQDLSQVTTSNFILRPTKSISSKVDNNSNIPRLTPFRLFSEPVSVSMTSTTKKLESSGEDASLVVAETSTTNLSSTSIMESTNSGKDSPTSIPNAVTSVAEGLSSKSVDDLKMQDSRSQQVKRKEFYGKTKKGKKLDKHPKKIQKFSNDEKFNETSSFIDDGLRRVKPYIYVFETHIKGRWMGRSVLDVFKGEFRMESPEYYAKAIRTGLITINGQKVTADKILRQNEFLRSMVHRHEPPVIGQPLDIITANEEFVVINKPASIPVHPCGKYRHNTIIFMLGKDHGMTGLHTIHRLDRLTSGLLMFARTREVSQRVDAYVRDRKLTKVYVCKVSGKFPSEPLECSQPIHTVSHKIGVCRVSPDGKQCKTAFQRLSFDGQTSIVQCTPHTGRMHQIRVHLQYLGYPIVNDPLYNNPVWGPELGKGGNVLHTNENDLLTELIKQHSVELRSQVIADPDDFVETTRPQPVQDVDLREDKGAAQEDAGPKGDGISALSCKETSSADDLIAESQDGRTMADQELNGLERTVSSAQPSDQQTTPASLEIQQCLGLPDASKLPDHGSHPASSDEQGGETGRVEPHDQSRSTSTSLSGVPDSASGLGPEKHLLEADRDLTEAERHALVRSLCRECKLKLRDPTPEEMTMYLHALSYKGPDFEFKTPLPEWVEEHIQRSAAMEVTTS